MKYKLAIIGYGGMGGYHHDCIAEKVDRIGVTGAWDIRPEALEKAEEKGLRAYTSLEELLADPQLDAVIIATPNNFHKDLSIACLRAGKHVVCEKPATLNAAELEEIIAAGRRADKLFTVHQNRRWDRDYCIIKSTLESGVIGEPYFIESRVQGSRRSMHGWRGYKVNGGGMLLDWGAHLLDQMLQLVPSPVVSVTAHLLSVFTPGVDDNIKLLLRFDNGVSTLLEMSTNCFVNLPRWHVSCTDGTAVVEDWGCSGKIVQLGEDGEMGWEDDIIYTEAGPTRTMAPRPAHTTRELPLPSAAPDRGDYYRNLAEAMDGTAELLVPPEQTLRVMRVIDLLFASAEQGKSMACRV